METAAPSGGLEYPKVLRLRTGKGWNWKLAVGLVLFGVIALPFSIASAIQGDASAWLWAIVAALLTAAAVFGIVGFPATLTLERDSFTYRGLFRVHYMWSDVELFYPTSLYDTTGAGYLLTDAAVMRSSRLVGMLGGRDVRMIAARNFDPDELSDLLNRYRLAAPYEPEPKLELPSERSDKRTYPPVVVWVLVAVNAVAFVWEVAHQRTLLPASDTSIPPGTLIPSDVATGDWWLTITAGFLHADPMHLLANMIGLLLIGPLLERLIGPIRFLAVYMVALLAGSVGAMLLTPTGATLGASGAVFGVFAAAVVADARGGGRATGGIALVLLGVNLFITFARPGISIGGHLGGALAGALVMLVLTRSTPNRQFVLRPAHEALPGVLGIALGVVVAAWLAAERSL